MNFEYNCGVHMSNHNLTHFVSSSIFFLFLDYYFYSLFYFIYEKTNDVDQNQNLYPKIYFLSHSEILVPTCNPHNVDFKHELYNGHLIVWTTFLSYSFTGDKFSFWFSGCRTAFKDYPSYLIPNFKWIMR